MAQEVGRLTHHALRGARRTTRRAIEGSPELLVALEGCLRAATIALVAQVHSKTEIPGGHFDRFLGSPAIGAELGLGVLRPQGRIDRDEIENFFEEAGEADGVAGVDLDEAITAFRAAFHLALQDEPSLREAIGNEDSHTPESLSGDLADLVTQAVLVTTQGQANGDVQADVITAHNVVSGMQMNNLFAGSVVVIDSGTAKAEAQAKSARRNYLVRLQRQCQYLPLVALGRGSSTEDDVSLDQIYIGLDTDQRFDTKTGALARKETGQDAEGSDAAGRLYEDQLDRYRPYTAIEAARDHERLVILGDPGSGKSTFVKKLVALQANAASVGTADEQLGWAANLTPVFVTLRDLAERLDDIDQQNLPGPKLKTVLAQSLRDQIIDDLSDLDAQAFADQLEQLADGRCLLVLDGLDEVPVELRARTRDAVLACASIYAIERVIVTCRVLSYTGDSVLKDFQEFKLAPFDSEKISRFANAWYVSQTQLATPRFTETAALEKAEDLASAALSSHMRELAENPMLLTTMAIVHQDDVSLPPQRVCLYSKAIDVLMRRWQEEKFGKKKMSHSTGLRDILRNRADLRPAMERLAYEAHRRGLDKAEKGAADLPRPSAIEILEQPEHLGDAGLASEFLDYVDQRAGLLVGRGGAIGKPAQYSFPHRTLQEYLAGCHMIGPRHRGREYFARAGEADHWALAARLGAEELLHNRGANSLNDLLDLAYELGSCAGTDEKSQRARLWSGAMAALLGPDRIERDVESAKGGKAYLERQVPALIEIVGGSLPPAERAEAGRVLAVLGDPRSEVMTIAGMELSYVPPGPFWMGSMEKDGMRWADERPQEEVDIEHGFWIGRYPITVAQFSEFVDAGGYEDSSLWPEAQAGGFWTEEGIKVWADDVPRKRPDCRNEEFDLANHPVVDISWFEALAFTRWLSALAHERGWLEPSMQLLLPSESEWEKAARGGIAVLSEPLVATLRALRVESSHMVDSPEPTQLFPFGDDLDPNRANFDDARVGITNTPGCFPHGASPYDCQDMSGNVWEWTRSAWKKYPYRADDGREESDAESSRVLRGGSFIDLQQSVRCSYRGSGGPGGRDSGGGFRVVVSPFLSDR